eukprot:comp9349_c0_seq2/m.10775 comp9349_c0_seq2/g.10775  ORF comp9349_c0_seq2/g.10775 comp9349_c0_seq2/m.10775 type:complete len:308 (-) comp9349_c0_seq2:918-1841(-)
MLPKLPWSPDTFYVAYSVYWIAFFGLVVISKEYNNWTDIGYTVTGLVVCVPAWFGFILTSNKIISALNHRSEKPVVRGREKTAPAATGRARSRSRSKSAADSTDTKKSSGGSGSGLSVGLLFSEFLASPVTRVNVYIAVLSFVGNYFYTHYFFKVLGAWYKFPLTWTINEIPVCMYLITHGYFLTYHVSACHLINRFKIRNAFVRLVAFAVVGYLYAVMEAVSISSVPLYGFKDVRAFYIWGSLFYAVMLGTQFIGFSRIDRPHAWDLTRTVIESMGFCMITFIFLDLWRLYVGPIYTTESIKPIFP